MKEERSPAAYCSPSGTSKVIATVGKKSRHHWIPQFRSIQCWSGACWGWETVSVEEQEPLHWPLCYTGSRQATEATERNAYNPSKLSSQFPLHLTLCHVCECLKDWMVTHCNHSSNFGKYSIINDWGRWECLMKPVGTSGICQNEIWHLLCDFSHDLSVVWEVTATSSTFLPLGPRSLPCCLFWNLWLWFQ